MADEQQELRRVSWTEVFSFAHIFKSFRMAVHPSKLLLALAGVVLIVAVGWVLGHLWYGLGYSAPVNAPYAYYRAGSRTAYQDGLADDRRRAAGDLLTLYRPFLEDNRFAPFIAAYSRQEGSATSDFGKKFAEQAQGRQGDDAERRKELAGQLRKLSAEPAVSREELDKAYEGVTDLVKKMLRDAEDLIAKAEDTVDDQSNYDAGQLDRDVQAARRALWQVKRDLINQACYRIHGTTVFAALADYEGECFESAIGAVFRGNFLGGFRTLLADRGRPPTAEAATPGAFAGAAALQGIPEGLGVLGWLFLLFWGVVWLLSMYPLYAILFLVVSLAIWAVFGGAIARIAALHAAREEKISMGQALRFAFSKFFSFFTAPLIPLAIILALGVVMGLGGLLATLPIGDIVVGVLFVLALVLGALVAFLTIGLGAGAPLMYPTIAVEGSDSFDAISRSFSYVFARPWRYALYSLVAVVYGALCYLFVRFFAFLALAATHFFVGNGFFTLGANTNGAPEFAQGAGKLDLLWTRPTFNNLGTAMNAPALGGIEWVASLLIHFWVYLVVGLVAAFVLSFAVSAHTVIYYLLRRKVDATDLDDVYIEEAEEPEGEAAAETPAVEPSPPPPAEEPPKDDKGESAPPA